MNNQKYPILEYTDEYKVIRFERISKNNAILTVSERPTNETYHQIWKKLDD